MGRYYRMLLCLESLFVQIVYTTESLKFVRSFPLLELRHQNAQFFGIIRHAVDGLTWLMWRGQEAKGPGRIDPIPQKRALTRDSKLGGGRGGRNGPTCLGWCDNARFYYGFFAPAGETPFLTQDRRVSKQTPSMGNPLSSCQGDKHYVPYRATQTIFR